MHLGRALLFTQAGALTGWRAAVRLLCIRAWLCLCAPIEGAPCMARHGTARGADCSALCAIKSFLPISAARVLLKVGGQASLQSFFYHETAYGRLFLLSWISFWLYND